MSSSSNPATESVTIGAVSGSPPTAPVRLDSIDLWRGVIMVIMALDHTRDYFTAGNVSIRDPHYPGLFLTRWITHLCASNFVFLAGVGAFLYLSRGRTRQQGSTFLLSRGLWLVLLELTVIRIGWSFHLWPDFVLLQVIWVIGWSMVLLAAGIYLPRPVLGALALIIIAGHNLLDGVEPSQFGRFSWLWSMLHRPTPFQLTPQLRVFELYPLIPWVAVLAGGYYLGALFLRPPEVRRRVLARLGAALLLLFVALRASGIYGDPVPWTQKDTALASVLSFFDCEKYPPSLLFLCLTLGLGLLALAAFEGAHGRFARIFVTYGRVPLFYYVAHIYLIHALAVALAALQIHNIAWLFHGLPPMAAPPKWNLSLPWVYLVWLLVVALLYTPCRWFGRFKRRHASTWWVSYV